MGDTMFILEFRNCDATGETVSYVVRGEDGARYTVTSEMLLSFAKTGQISKKVVNAKGQLNAAYIRKLPKRNAAYSAVNANALIPTVNNFGVDIQTGDALPAYLHQLLNKSWNYRPEFHAIMKKCHTPLQIGNKRGHTLVLKGLRRTGKTVLLLQAVQQLINEGVNPNEIAFVTITLDNLSVDTLVNTLAALSSTIKYVFIDEATRCTELLAGGLDIVDTYKGALANAHIILSGTESFTFVIGELSQWYGRISTLSTTSLSYKDYIALFRKKSGAQSLIKYITTAGTFDFEHVLSKSERTNIIFASIITNIRISLQRNTIALPEYERIKNAPMELITHIVFALLSRDRIYFGKQQSSLLSLVMGSIIDKCDSSKPNLLLTARCKSKDLKREYDVAVQQYYMAELQDIFASAFVQKITAQLCNDVFQSLITLGTFCMIRNLATSVNLTAPHLQLHDGMYVPTLYNVKYSFSQAYKQAMLEVAQLSKYKDITLLVDKQVTHVLYGDALENAVLLNCRNKFGKKYTKYLRFSYVQGDTEYTPEVDVVVQTKDSHIFLEVKYSAKASSSKQCKNFEDPYVYSIIEQYANAKCYVVYMGPSGIKSTLKNGLQVEWLNACELLNDLSILGEPKGDA